MIYDYDDYLELLHPSRFQRFSCKITNKNSPRGMKSSDGYVSSSYFRPHDDNIILSHQIAYLFHSVLSFLYPFLHHPFLLDRSPNRPHQSLGAVFLPWCIINLGVLFFVDRLLGLTGSILLDAGLLYTGFSICHFLDWALRGFWACTFSMGQINLDSVSSQSFISQMVRREWIGKEARKDQILCV